MAKKKTKIDKTGSTLDVSVVVPVYNEKGNTALLYHSIKFVLDNLHKSYEIIFIDDGSGDGTREILRGIALKDSNFRVILLRRNFGQSAAMAAGFKKSRGAVVIAMDGDLQNDPKDIPRLLEKIQEGYDVVSGWRKDRKDKLLFRKIPSKIANRLITSVTDVQLHDTGCSLKAFQQDVINHIRVYGELHRFIPALARIEGARISEIVVKHHPRRFGKSKYNITRTFRVLMDLCSLKLFVKYLRNPFRFFGQIGLGVFCLSFMSSMWVVYRIYFYRIPLPDLNIIITMIFLMWVAGFQFFFFGLVASLIVKTGQKHGVALASFQWFREEDYHGK